MTSVFYCLSEYSVPQSGSWSPPWHEARKTAGFAGHRCPQLQKHLRTSFTLLYQGMTGEERGGSTRLIISKHKNKNVMWWFRHSRQVIWLGHRTQGQRILCLSKPGLCSSELFLCVRTTYPIIVYNYNTVKSKIEHRLASILVLVGCRHNQEPTTRLAANSPIMNGSITFDTKPMQTKACHGQVNHHRWPHALRTMLKPWIQ